MNTNNTKHLFKELPKIAYEHPAMKAIDQLVLATLYDVIKDKGISRHRNKTLARLCKVSERSVARVLNKLETLGFIVREGMSFTRKFTLGKLFALSRAIYAKRERKKKNLPSHAKNVFLKRRNDNHTKNIIPNNKYSNDQFTLEELQTLKWYKDNPWANVKKEDLYLFT